MGTAVVLGATALVASAAEPRSVEPQSAEPQPAEAEPSLVEPLPFDHDLHAPGFEKKGVTCVACHPIGLTQQLEDQFASPVEALPANVSTCHACHLSEVRGAPPRRRFDLRELPRGSHGAPACQPRAGLADAARGRGARAVGEL